MLKKEVNDEKNYGMQGFRKKAAAAVREQVLETGIGAAHDKI